MREWLLRILRGIALLNAFGQLAVSQVHIDAITKIFAKEIGFYLFLFIIFCLVTGFNSLLLETYRGIAFFAFTNWITAGAGYVYLRILEADVADQQALTLADVETTRNLVIAAIIICLINSIALPYLSWGKAKMS